MAIKKPVALVILDGFGYRADPQYNAIAQAQMRHFNTWLLEYPHVLLHASGTAVGLPENAPGNSLAGHTTLGAGRVSLQTKTIFDHAIADGTLFTNPLLLERFAQVKKLDGTLHLMGLLSDGGNHSHEEHLYALMRMAKQQGITKILVHVFLDGRDVLPHSAAQYLEHLDAVFKEIGCGQLATMHGRGYAMDYAGRAEYIKKSYEVLTQPHKSQFATWHEALEYYYAQGLSDDMIPPTTIITNSYMKEHDGVICFNIRADHSRGLIHMFLEHKIPQLAWLITSVSYNPRFETDVLFHHEVLQNTLLDVLEDAQCRTFIIAESEKYAHVSYFFNGGREVVHPHELRLVIPSVPPQKMLAHPEMSAPEITDSLLRSLTKNPRDFYLVNYANADLLGHTGNMEATIQALHVLDVQLERLYNLLVERMGGMMFIVADHGKAEEMYDEKAHEPKTAHTTNPVYFVMLQKELRHHPTQLPLHGLADVAPFILQQMHIPVPHEMTGEKAEVDALAPQAANP